MQKVNWFTWCGDGRFWHELRPFVQIKLLFTLREPLIIVNMTTQRIATGLPQNDLALLQRAFDALRRATGFEGRLVATQVTGEEGQRADAVVEIAAEGQRYQYVAEIKRVDRCASFLSCSAGRNCSTHPIARLSALLVLPSVPSVGFSTICRDGAIPPVAPAKATAGS